MFHLCCFKRFTLQQTTKKTEFVFYSNCSFFLWHQSHFSRRVKLHFLLYLPSQLKLRNWTDAGCAFRRYRLSLLTTFLKRVCRFRVQEVHAYLLTPWSRVILEKLTGSAASQEFPRNFMEPEISSPYSQVPAICPYPEPTPSCLHPLTLPEGPS